MRSMPAAQLFFRTGKGIQRMRANSVWRLAIQEGLLFAVLATCVTVAYAQRPSGPRADEDTFRFRFLGPRAGNRVASIAGVPGDPSTYYAGAASGGVWKTTDAGNRWEPIFDKQPVAAIGAIAVAPSDRKSTRLNSSHVEISYAVFCLKKKKKKNKNKHKT